MHTFEELISIENLLEAWQEFIVGKRSRRDVQEFECDLMANLFDLHRDLASTAYHHGQYEAFKVSDPKPRNIHKATVRDRVLHRAAYRKLYPFFDRLFIADSYSCRVGKGTHKALDRFRAFAQVVSKNRTRTGWVLKCDIRKFFASIDQATLVCLLSKRVEDDRSIQLLRQIIGSFDSGKSGVGLPLGNLTSQLFANVYLHELDSFAKHFLTAKHYIRYADDFVFLSHDRKYLEALLPIIEQFLRERLRLEMHPDKVFMKTVASGVDFLGWVHFPDHRVLRTATRRRMTKAVCAGTSEKTLASYRGMLGHGNARKLAASIGRLEDRRGCRSSAI